MSSKNIRKMLSVNEKSVCFKCSKKDKCKFFEIVPIGKNEERIATISDLQLVLYGLYNNTLNNFNNDAIKKINSDGNKKDNLINEENSNQNNQNEINQIIKRISNKNWNSANIIMELMNETVQDLVYNNGIVLKTLINAYIETKQEEESNQLLEKEHMDKLKEKENDPYVNLLKDLRHSKNRKEKKILISKFNKQVGFGWGEYRKVFTEKESEVKYTQEEPTHKSNNKQPFREEGSKYINTTFISDKNLNQIENSKNERKMVTQQFSQKINMKNTKIKFLQGQQNLSLLMNQNRQDQNLLTESNEKSYVKVPGADYKRAISYLKEDSTRVEDFKDEIESKRKEYSLDIRKTIYKKLNKIDRKLQENKKFTLKKQLENVENLENNNHKLALNSFENKLLENSNSDNDTTSPLVNSSNLEEYKSTKIIDIKNTNLQVENIQFTRQNKSTSGMEFYKQQNLETKEKMEKGQKLSKIKKIIKNKHVYKAENFYNNYNMEHLRYEKDSDISKDIQFEKNITDK